MTGETGQVVANRQWTLARRPRGAPRVEDFALIAGSVEAPGPGEVVLRNRFLAMDPAIRNVLGQGGAYAEPLPLGVPVRGMVLGEVVASADPSLAPGDLAWGFGTWSDYSRGPASGLHKVDGDAEPATYLHQRGTIGLTAAYGLFGIGGLRPGDKVLVTGAAGAVGSLVGQMAKAGGASRVVGIAGGPAKCLRATGRYGYDACLDYKAGGDLGAQLAEAFPDGIDVVFDNVGGRQLEAAIDHIAKDARIALCGMISGYGQEGPAAGIGNLWNLVARTARIHGFRVTDILGDPDRRRPFQDRIEALIAAGQLEADLDIRVGLEGVPATFAALFDGSHEGRLLVRLD